MDDGNLDSIYHLAVISRSESSMDDGNRQAGTGKTGKKTGSESSMDDGNSGFTAF